MELFGSKPSLQKIIKTAIAGFVEPCDRVSTLLVNVVHDIDFIHAMYQGLVAWEVLVLVMVVYARREEREE